MPVLLSEFTTIRLGGPAARFATARDSAELVELVREADGRGEPVLVLGGGSNLVIGDQGFDGLVVRVASQGMQLSGTTLRVQAGVEWDAVVRESLAAGLAGLEALSGIPGTAGGTPIQNVGAYGALTSNVLSGVTVYDRATGEVEQWDNARCGFGNHRYSVFKRNARYVILDVSYALTASDRSAPVGYAALADRLGVPIGADVPAAEVRAAVLQLRGERGMVLDQDDHDTWSVGSFFLNPVLAEVPARAAESPQYPDPDGTKLPAGWLIQHAGFRPGYGTDWGRGTVALSSRHALAITNRGGATTAEVMKFAAHIREGVERAFDIRLRPECDLVNCELG
ncbi:MAG TPA: UDP-N-acetylmuramate dehydrogenase [Jatrophihabitans sp.]|nr:UDP-N-acetylmuramate dehydrogenase [Jatrophihabitans sp.]